MSIASLINPSNEGFAFDHDQLHRQMRAAQASGALTPILDPIIGADVPSGDWNYEHTIAHAEFAAAVPSINWPSTASITDVAVPDEFWALANKVLHDLALTQLP